MNELSDRAKELLAAYREQAAPSAGEHDLGLQRLLERAARGDVPSPEYDVAPPELGAATGGGAGLGLKAVTTLKWAAAGIAALGLAAVVMVGAGAGRPKAASPSPQPLPAQAAPRGPGDEPRAPAPSAPAPAAPASLAPGPPRAEVAPRGAQRKSTRAAAVASTRGASAGGAPPARVSAPAASAPPANPSVPTASAPPARAPAAASAPPARVPAPAAAAPPAPASPAVHAPATRVPAAAVEPLADGVDAEMALMERALDAVRRRAFAQALAATNDHMQRFPAGSLSETRDVTRVLALCGLGRRAEAARAAQQFLLARPHSPFASKVANACPTPQP